MISSSVASWPDAWPRRPHLRVYWVLLVGVLISVLLVLGLMLISTGPPAAAAAAVLLWGGFHIGATAIGLRFFLRPYSRRRSTIELAGPALFIRYRSARVTVAAFGIPYAVTGGLILVGVGLRRDDVVAVVFGGLPIAVGAVLGVLAVRVARGHYGLYLNPDEVQWRSLRRTVAVSWDVVRGVVARHTPELVGPIGPTEQGLYIQVRLHAVRIVGSGTPPDDDILIPAGQLTAAPALAFWVVEHYFRHPEHRHELGTDAAIERIRRGPV